MTNCDMPSASLHFEALCIQAYCLEDSVFGSLYDKIAIDHVSNFHCPKIFRREFISEN